MKQSFARRTFLTAGGAIVAAGLAPANASASGEDDRAIARSAPFTLNSEVLDGGEQITSVTIDASGAGGLDEGDIPLSAFTIRAKGTNPLTGAVAYDVPRMVRGARANRQGQIVLDLEHGEGMLGCATLDYIPSVGRNVMLDLEYSIAQVGPLPRRGRSPRWIQAFVQGRLVNSEVDAFSRHVAASGTNYRLFSPKESGRSETHPLVVWLHGGGEGGLLEGEYPHDYYDNETLLRANRGALGFATDEAQALFGGAYVVAPQSPSKWMADGPGYARLISEVIEEVSATYPVDRDRIHLAGCSNGGYMTLKMLVENPHRFASAIPICPVVGVYKSVGPYVPDEQLVKISTPTWLVAAADDTTVDPQANTVHAHRLISGSVMSLYDNVTWNGHRFPGHFSWIYSARNDPSVGGIHLWEWMASQRR